MKQVFVDPRAGSIEVADLPSPALRPGTILVRNAFSVISPGTERNVVRSARDSYLTTARARPDLVRRVIDTVRREGVLAAYRKVHARMSELRPLGYSSAGTVLAVGPSTGDYFKVGDRVACAGAGHASHAEIVCVPVNLAARVPDQVPLDAAAFATLGAVALHGIRQSEPMLGERFAVIGLGVIGLLTVQLLRANGVRVIAFDLSPELADRALALGAESAMAGSSDEQVAAALGWSDGIGVDGVIVAAAAIDDAPMVAAAGMCRDRARVTAVGLVPFGLPREIAYEKELDLRIARSYGPGRYDPDFEERGVEYPIGYVRWTETRNLDAFLRLVEEGRLNPLCLVTHNFTIDDASSAFQTLVSGTPTRPLGIMISYPQVDLEARGSQIQAATTEAHFRSGPTPETKVTDHVIGFIGAGTFARSTLLPILTRQAGVRLRSVVTAHGLTALRAQRTFGFEAIGTDPELVLSDPNVQLVFIATRHDSHADLAVRALLSGKHVFVEKPLALNEEQLAQIGAAAESTRRILMVGFNRRFSRHARAIRRAFEDVGPLMMQYRVNAGFLPPEHWAHDPVMGGGRLIGEACHFVDLMSYLTGDVGLLSVEARSPARSSAAADDASVFLSFADGSVGHLLYTAKGSPRIGKERLEVHGGGSTAILDDFRRCTVAKKGSLRKVRGLDKGHRDEIRALIEAVRNDGPPPIRLNVIQEVTRATFRIAQALSADAR